VGCLPHQFGCGGAAHQDVQRRIVRERRAARGAAAPEQCTAAAHRPSIKRSARGSINGSKIVRNRSGTPKGKGAANPPVYGIALALSACE